LSFSQQEYFFAFDSFVWPQAIKIPSESLTSVSNILKIFSSWSERPIYYPLFVVNAKSFNTVNQSKLRALTSNDKSVIEYFSQKNILDVLFQLLDAPKCSQQVINFLLDMIHNFVTFADFNERSDKDEMEEQDAYMNTKQLPFNLDFIKSEFKDHSSE
jgi:hypothetical protein